MEFLQTQGFYVHLIIFINSNISNLCNLIRELQL